MNEEELALLIERTVRDTLERKPTDEIPIGVSNRHVHLSPEAVERLFGSKDALTKLKDLSQPGQFACNETVTLIGPKGRIERVRILGPARGDTQVEISLFDGFTLGIAPPIRDSGDIAGTPGLVLQGPRGQLTIGQGVICAARHIHMHPADAEAFGVRNGQRVSVRVGGPRALTMDNVLIRVSEKYRLEMHIDLDEANAGRIRTGQIGVLLQS
ncbi:phosphate propanoyltransferase [Paenibacillus athensensis]|uniref:Phosphate propanoyltransferase n=1 Tax=Paenibacillus athensensis TaxID=1967502 RepID=A0A4Y8PZ07_9BACL|nr:phosphate propanoyltransferase [Paenibacillus athensensis]MCD1260455.1 phosphate propanoyltransferase [Paenibacillus athensensis]